MRRRTFLTVVPAAAAATSGCIGVLTGDEALERRASQARVASATLDETGYEMADSSSQEIEREVTAGGQTRTVRAVNEIAEYQRTVSVPGLGEQEYAVFAVVSTPAFEIGGRTMSPVAEWSNRKVAQQIQDQYENLEVGAEVDQHSIGTLSSEMPLSTFEGTATFDDESGIDVYLHVGKVEHESDFVIVVGVHPQQLPDEDETVRRLVRNLTHGD